MYIVFWNIQALLSQLNPSKLQGQLSKTLEHDLTNVSVLNGTKVIDTILLTLW